MIGVRSVASGRRRRGRAALLLGLVLLVVWHVSGMVHASPAAGAAYVDATVAHCAHHGPASGPHHAGDTPPGHDHSGTGHVDHSVDRPRASDADTPTVAAAPDPLAPGAAPLVMLPPAMRSPVRDTTAAAAPPEHDSLLDLHCVRRQ
ncbi:hypothetical protein ACFVTY_04215 [Streptomyces sp. NPDC058067]|uniref:hypothetical protein n=1 Tax=Streptomyces sp. NPDC058067 TaxID=3346324 RepID=UPI0036E61B8B